MDRITARYDFMDTVIRNGAGCLFMSFGVTGCGFTIVPNECDSDLTRTLEIGF